jgi:hypothetical protein
MNQGVSEIKKLTVICHCLFKNKNKIFQKIPVLYDDKEKVKIYFLILSLTNRTKYSFAFSLAIEQENIKKIKEYMLLKLFLG